MIHAYSIFKYRNEKQRYICFGQITYQNKEGMFSKPIIFDFNAKNDYVARARFWSKNKDDFVKKLKDYYFKIDCSNFRDMFDDNLFYNIRIGEEAIKFIKNYINLECKIFNLILSDCCVKENRIEDYGYIEYYYNNFEKIREDYNIFVFDKNEIKIKRLDKYVMLHTKEKVYGISKPTEKFIKDFKYVTVLSRPVDEILKKEYKELEKKIISE